MVIIKQKVRGIINQENIDLAIIGTHGLTGLTHFFWGSTAERIVRRANCSVLAVHLIKKLGNGSRRIQEVREKETFTVPRAGRAGQFSA